MRGLAGNMSIAWELIQTNEPSYCFKMLRRFLEYNYYKFWKRQRFYFNGDKYRYFYDLFNVTFRNERAIEIPIVMEYVKQHRGKDILEVGNVLSHYYDFEHTVVDKYDVKPWCIHRDILNYFPNKKFDLVVSVSTLEHVGWDENPRDGRKGLAAITHLQNLLKPGGVMAITVPVGYNPILDTFIISRFHFPFMRKYFMKRVSKKNRWIQVDDTDLKSTQYGFPYPCANGLMIGVVKT